jgi:hypothetical protein
MTGILDAAADGRKVGVAAPCERPRPLEAREAKGLLKDSD